MNVLWAFFFKEAHLPTLRAHLTCFMSLQNRTFNNISYYVGIVNLFSDSVFMRFCIGKTYIARETWNFEFRTKMVPEPHTKLKQVRCLQKVSGWYPNYIRRQHEDVKLFILVPCHPLDCGHPPPPSPGLRDCWLHVSMSSPRRNMGLLHRQVSLTDWNCNLKSLFVFTIYPITALILCCTVDTMSLFIPIQLLYWFSSKVSSYDKFPV